MEIARRIPPPPPPSLTFRLRNNSSCVISLSRKLLFVYVFPDVIAIRARILFATTHRNVWYNVSMSPDAIVGTTNAGQCTPPALHAYPGDRVCWLRATISFATGRVPNLTKKIGWTVIGFVNHFTSLQLRRLRKIGKQVQLRPCQLWQAIYP